MTDPYDPTDEFDQQASLTNWVESAVRSADSAEEAQDAIDGNAAGIQQAIKEKSVDDLLDDLERARRRHAEKARKKENQGQDLAAEDHYARASAILEAIEQIDDGEKPRSVKVDVEGRMSQAERDRDAADSERELAQIRGDHHGNEEAAEIIDDWLPHQP